MIRTVKGELIAECDECGEEHPGGTLEFLDFIADLKDCEWKIRKDDESGEWTHTCPACSEE